MFDGKYFDWNQKRIKGIVDFYKHKFFYYKKVLDLGCGYGDLGGVIYRLGADITEVDARPEHLKIVSKKYPGIKTLKADLDHPWQFGNQKFDLILDLGLLCHLRSYEDHIRNVCAATTHLVLETAVCDSNDPDFYIKMPENKGSYDLSANGGGCRPSVAAIESLLTKCGMNFKRVDSAQYNSGDYVYNWDAKNDGSTSLEKRRIWFCVKKDSHVQFAAPKKPVQLPTPQPVDYSGPIHYSEFNQNTITDTLPIRDLKDLAPPDSIIVNNKPIIDYNTVDKKFVIVIPSYNNKTWCEKNIKSALDQNYTNFRIIFVDDCSSDNTFETTLNFVKTAYKENNVTLVRNSKRIGALANLYNMIHSCDDDEIILTLDGDDWLANDEVLNILNSVYSNGDVWMTYGQYKNSTDGGEGVARQYPQHVIDRITFRQHAWCASHLRTFYTWLFRSIRKEDLLFNNEFYKMTWDFAIMFPMLEMSGPHSKFLNNILYVYNLENPINDHKVNKKLQQDLDRQLRSKAKYPKVAAPPPKPSKVGLLLIATGKYDRYISGMIASADKYFLNKKADVTYYVFSDKPVAAQSARNVVYIPIEHKQFPFASMDRFKHFTNNSEFLSKEDYLYYVDVDCLFVDGINTDILGELVGVRHCGYINKIGPFESNPLSCLFADPSKYQCYYGGGFSGGKAQNYLSLSKWCSEKIEQDVANGIIPIWHDETALNRYFLEHTPTIALSPSYHYPQSNLPYYKKMWGNVNWQPKIILLDKDHSEIRQ